MKKLVLFLCFITLSIKAQIGVPQVVNDPEANAILKTLTQQQSISNSKALLEAKNTVLEINKQYEFLSNAVSKVEAAVTSLEIVNSIKTNSVGVVGDYSRTLNELRNYRNLNPTYVNNQLIRLENIVISNRKSFNFFSSLIKNDMLKMSSYERIQLMQDVNQKIVSLRSAIFNISRDAAIKNQQAANRKGIYSIPILK